MSSLPPEQELALLKAQHAQGSAITLQGINRYWPQIVGAVVIGVFLVDSGKEQQALMGRVDTLERNAESVVQVRKDQDKTSGEVRELQIAVKNIQTSQQTISAQIDAIAGEVRAMNTMVGSISQALRNR